MSEKVQECAVALACIKVDKESGCAVFPMWWSSQYIPGVIVSKRVRGGLPQAIAGPLVRNESNIIVFLDFFSTRSLTLFLFVLSSLCHFLSRSRGSARIALFSRSVIEIELSVCSGSWRNACKNAGSVYSRNKVCWNSCSPMTFVHLYTAPLFFMTNAYYHETKYSLCNTFVP